MLSEKLSVTHFKPLDCIYFLAKAFHSNRLFENLQDIVMVCFTDSLSPGLNRGN